MIKSVKVTNFLGESIVLDLYHPEKSGFIIKSIEGLGPATANINITELATADGGVINSSKLQTRNITLNLLFIDDPEKGRSIEDCRLISYKYFPIKHDLTFLIETDRRVCMAKGEVEHNEPAIFNKQEGCQISIVCPDPYFYSMNEITTIFYGVEPLFEFPFENDSLTEKLIEMGSIENQTERPIYYEGDAEVGVVITIHAIGEASNIMIYNTGTREVMIIDTGKLAQLTGYGIIAGDDLIISTVRGEKYIRLLRMGIYTNVLNCLDKNSDWFLLSKGDNIFTYVAETGSENLQFKIEHKISYEGV